MNTERAGTKKCPFCAEIIQAEAIKCRYCGEFLNTLPQPGRSQPNAESQDTQDQEDDVLYWAKPSLWALSVAWVKTILILALAGTLIFLPVEKLLHSLSGRTSLNETQIADIDRYMNTAGLCIAAVMTLVLLLKIVKLKSTHYEVTPDRIEWARGIFNRKIDNLDMFRVVDIKLHRSLLDCLVGIGTVNIVTKDQTDPQFSFLKVPEPKLLYDILKKASLDADRKRGVVHLE